METCRYTTWQDDRGWNWRLELRPADANWRSNRGSQGQEPGMLPFPPNCVRVNSLLHEFDGVPVGLSNPPVLNLTVDTSELDAATTRAILQIDRDQVTENCGSGDNLYLLYIWCANTWILQTDYGTGQLHNIYIGVQTDSPVVELNTESGVLAPVEIECRDLLGHLLKIADAKAVSALILSRLHAGTLEHYETKCTYQLAFRGAHTVKTQYSTATVQAVHALREYWSHDDVEHKHALVLLGDINTVVLAFLKQIATIFRVDDTVIGPAGFRTNHLIFYGYNGEADGGTIALSTLNGFTNAASATEAHQALYVVAATRVQPGTAYIGGLFVEGSDGYFFEGANLLEAISFTSTGWGGKQVFATGDRCELRNGAILAGLPTVLDVGAVAHANVAVRYGEQRVKSVAFNTTGFSEDITEHRQELGGVITEADLDKKCVHHSLPACRKYESDNDPWSDLEPNIVRGIYLRQSPPSARSFYYRHKYSWAKSGFADGRIPCRVHQNVDVRDGIGFPNAPVAPVALTATNMLGAMTEMQIRSGLPNNVARVLLSLFGPQRTAVVELTVDAGVINPNDVGGVFHLNFSYSALLAAMLHNPQGVAIAVCTSVNVDFVASQTAVKFLVVDR